MLTDGIILLRIYFVLDYIYYCRIIFIDLNVSLLTNTKHKPNKYFVAIKSNHDETTVCIHIFNRRFLRRKSVDNRLQSPWRNIGQFCQKVSGNLLVRLSRIPYTLRCFKQIVILFYPMGDRKASVANWCSYMYTYMVVCTLFASFVNAHPSQHTATYIALTIYCHPSAVRGVYMLFFVCLSLKQCTHTGKLLLIIYNCLAFGCLLSIWQNAWKLRSSEVRLRLLEICWLEYRKRLQRCCGCVYRCFYYAIS